MPLDDDRADIYARLRVYPPPEVSLEDISVRLGLEATESWHDRDIKKLGGRPAGWLFSSQGQVSTRDSSVHIHWLLDQVEPALNQLQALELLGCKVDVRVFWSSESGHGGPTHDRHLSRRLAEFGLDVTYDVFVPPESGWL